MKSARCYGITPSFDSSVSGSAPGLQAPMSMRLVLRTGREMRDSLVPSVSISFFLE
ncbi:hypothetical protein BaRGS_00018903, partial [Batillaria attramentaria]